MEEFLQQLNEKQREAVVEKYGSLLVLAGAGSGKTKVLTQQNRKSCQIRNKPVQNPRCNLYKQGCKRNAASVFLKCSAKRS